jgi:hypothetical protein
MKKSKFSKKKVVNIQEEHPTNMDSLIQQVKAQPIVKEAEVGKNKKNKNCQTIQI